MGLRACIAKRRGIPPSLDRQTGLLSITGWMPPEAPCFVHNASPNGSSGLPLTANMALRYRDKLDPSLAWAAGCHAPHLASGVLLSIAPNCRQNLQAKSRQTLFAPTFSSETRALSDPHQPGP